MSDTVKHPTDSNLIAATRVESSTVFDVRGERIGTVKDVFVDKRSGQVEYVAMASGGLLGVGEKHHRLPWSALRPTTTTLAAIAWRWTRRRWARRRSTPTICSAATRRPGSVR